MHRNRDAAKRLMHRVIVDGATTSLWFDLRINHKNLVDLLGWDIISMFSTSVNAVAFIIRHHQLKPELLPGIREVGYHIAGIIVDSQQ